MRELTEELIRERAQKVFERRMHHVDKLAAKLAEKKEEVQEIQNKIDELCPHDADVKDWCEAKSELEGSTDDVVVDEEEPSARQTKRR